jgi:hypothetical protein
MKASIFLEYGSWDLDPHSTYTVKVYYPELLYGNGILKFRPCYSGEAIPLSGEGCGADLVGAEVSGEDDLWLRYLGHVAHLAHQMLSYGCLVLKSENNIISARAKGTFVRELSHAP